MTPDFGNTRTLLDNLRKDGLQFFADIKHYGDPVPFDFDNLVLYGSNSHDTDYYWSKLDDKEQQKSTNLQSDFMQVVKTISNSMKHSSLLTEADTRDLGTWTKSVRSSLRLRQYQTWDAEIIHDEGMVLGFQPARQSDANPINPEQAVNNFERDISNLLGLIALLEVSPTLSSDEFRANPQATAQYEPNSAFVMMQIDPQEPELEDRYNAIKEMCSQFGITAIRADEIEHEDVITEKIRERIRLSEFLIADLTGERPSVYYEIGYAHALSRKVIMYRHSGTNLHFDIAHYNCPEYISLTDLKTKLQKRLEDITNLRLG